MMTHEILEEDGIVLVHPSGPLSESDFQQLSQSVDHYLETHDIIQGLVIRTRVFPGWEDFGGFVQHFKFVKGHHETIKKVALVTDSKLASLAEHLGSHFVSAEIQQFDDPEFEAALAWIRSE